MKRLIGKLTLTIVVMIAANWNGASNAAQLEPQYKGKPLSQWLTSIRNRDAGMETAFEAIRALGPDASIAVPDLTQIVAGPFTPVQVGVDQSGSVVAKLSEIELRANAVDALAAIGEAASSSSGVLIHWALTVRVISGDPIDARDQKRFVDLVVMDVLERMRVAAAVAQFGRGAAPALAALLASPDGEARKLGVAILNEKALTIAAALLKLSDCDERELGIAILVDMWPVVARDHVIALDKALACGSQYRANATFWR